MPQSLRERRNEIESSRLDLLSQIRRKTVESLFTGEEISIGSVRQIDEYTQTFRLVIYSKEQGQFVDQRGVRFSLGEGRVLSFHITIEHKIHDHTDIKIGNYVMSTEGGDGDPRSAEYIVERDEFEGGELLPEYCSMWNSFGPYFVGGGWDQCDQSIVDWIDYGTLPF